VAAAHEDPRDRARERQEHDDEDPQGLREPARVVVVGLHDVGDGVDDQGKIGQHGEYAEHGRSVVAGGLSRARGAE
jgi:hypothetical protein